MIPFHEHPREDVTLKQKILFYLILYPTLDGLRPKYLFRESVSYAKRMGKAFIEDCVSLLTSIIGIILFPVSLVIYLVIGLPIIGCLKIPAVERWFRQEIVNTKHTEQAY